MKRLIFRVACVVAHTLLNTILSCQCCKKGNPVYFVCLNKTRDLGKTGGKKAFMFCQVLGIFILISVLGWRWEDSRERATASE
jgi:hypothetical protein